MSFELLQFPKKRLLPRIYFVLLRFLIVNSRIYTKKRLLKCIQDALIKFVKHFMHSWREQKSASENITHSRLAPSILLIRWFSLTPGCPKIIMNLILNSLHFLKPILFSDDLRIISSFSWHVHYNQLWAELI